VVAACEHYELLKSPVASPAGLFFGTSRAQVGFRATSKVTPSLGWLSGVSLLALRTPIRKPWTPPKAAGASSFQTKELVSLRDGSIPLSLIDKKQEASVNPIWVRMAVASFWNKAIPPI
jgi:hypothetical protein